MEWTVPEVAQTRDLNEWWAEDVLCQHDLESATETLHVPDAFDFCTRCGADLHVTRLRVKRVSHSDVWRLHICKAAWDSAPVSSAAGRRFRSVAELPGLPSANAPVVHHERFAPVDLGVEVFINLLGRLPVYGGILARSAARLHV